MGTVVRRDIRYAPLIYGSERRMVQRALVCLPDDETGKGRSCCAKSGQTLGCLVTAVVPTKHQSIQREGGEQLNIECQRIPWRFV